MPRIDRWMAIEVRRAEMLRLHWRWPALSAVLAGLLTMAGVALAPAAQALSQTPARTFVTNGSVSAIAPTASAIYIGGSFTRVGPRTGPGAGIDSSTAKSTGLPEVAGGGPGITAQTVMAVAPDGSGGFYIGGDFSRVGGVARNNLAHILANGSLDASWNPSANGAVRALAVSGSIVYVGGNFTSIGGQNRSNIAALATSGAATGWNPSASGGDAYFAGVDALAVSGSIVYVGGNFTSIGGQSRNHIAAINATTGTATGWNPNASSGPNELTIVHALAVSGGTVYAGGYFTSIGGQPRSHIAAINAATGAATSWNPNPAPSGPTTGDVNALAVSGGIVYVGGYFTSIGGQSRSNIAALNRTSAAATSWNPKANNQVLALVVSDSTVYAGGYFTKIGGQVRSTIAALNRTGGAATGWSPNANGSFVAALAVSGSTVYAGGDFTSIGGVTRQHIAALDPTTGRVTSWNPNATPSGYGGDVFALAVSGPTVYAGGFFDRIGGKPRNRIAALNRTTGAATSWNPNVTGNWVEALAVSSSTVYAGGAFHWIGSQPRKSRNYIAAINRTSGAATSWNPGADNVVSALRVSGPTVYATGRFFHLGGQPRSHIGALNATSGAATSWNPSADGDPDGYVHALHVSGSTVYAGGLFTSIGGQSRGNIAALDATSGAATAWNPGANNAVRALAVSGPTVYAGGHFTSIGSQNRNGIAALDATSGAATAWNPNPNGGTVTLAVGPDGSLWAGGGFTGFPTVPQAGIARFKP